MKILILILLQFFLIQYSTLAPALAQSPTSNQKSANRFVSEADVLFNIKSIGVSPAFDNTNQIYAKHVTTQLQNILKNDRQWTLANPSSSESFAPELYEEDSKLVLSTTKKLNAQALLTARITKTDKETKVTLYLFSGMDGNLLLKEESKDFNGFSIQEVSREVESLYSKMKSKLPFHGMILSRKNQMVTLNLGLNQGINVDDELTAVQVIKLNRHPRFKFLISTDREILGKVKIYKVDDELSFANILNEKDTGALEANTKLMTQNFVKYTTPIAQDGKVIDELSNRGDKDLSYGENPEEWVPERSPSFGKIGLLAGFSQYSLNTDVPSVDSFSADSNFAPTGQLSGELWLNQQWFMSVHIKQSVLTDSNPRSGSSPETLNISMSQFRYQFGYNFLIANEFWGPKVAVALGMSQSKNYVDSTTPETFTTQSFNGLTFHVNGSFPLDFYPMTLGAQFVYYWNPSLTESPIESGSATVNANSFGLYGIYHLKQRLHLRGEIGFDVFSANFSGSGTRAERATSSSTKLNSYLFGIEYLF